MCQLNTDPMKSQTAFVHVVGNLLNIKKRQPPKNHLLEMEMKLTDLGGGYNARRIEHESQQIF